MKADDLKFIASYFDHIRQIKQYKPHMHPGNYFWDKNKIADDKLQVVSFHNHLVAGYDIEN